MSGRFPRAGRTTGDVHRAIVALAREGRRFALAVVLKDEGSAPRSAGAKALIESDGAIHGTIGGGWVEAETLGLAVEAIRSGRPVAADFVLQGGSAAGDKPLCGGAMRILIDPAAGRRAAYGRAVRADRLRRRGVLLTSFRTRPGPASDPKVEPAEEVAVQWVPEGAAPAAIRRLGCSAGAIRAALRRQTPELLVRQGGRLEVLVEPVVPPPRLLIAGGGHVGQALALQADLAGFAVMVLDDRPEFTDGALFPNGVITRCGAIPTLIGRFTITGDTYIVIATRGHRGDRAALVACIRKPAAYIGMIGSRRKVALLRKDLLDAGAASAKEFGRVYAPIGLDIGAETVPEIAASIVAQLIAVRRKGSAPRIPAR